MTTKQAKQYGREIASDILRYGDFSEEEKQDQDRFSEAFQEIVDNRIQYSDFSFFASEINKSKNSDLLWDYYQSGVDEAFSKFIDEAF